jgi:hypothetical protein
MELCLISGAKGEPCFRTSFGRFPTFRTTHKNGIAVFWIPLSPRHFTLAIYKRQLPQHARTGLQRGKLPQR